MTAAAADRSDQPNPGADLARKVKSRPTNPATKSSQPKNTAVASPAIGGTTMAPSPRTHKMIPSARNRPQWSCMDWVRVSASSDFSVGCSMDMIKTSLVSNLYARGTVALKNDRPAFKRPRQQHQAPPRRCVKS